MEVYDFPLQGHFSVCIFGMVFYSDSCPHTPSSSFLAQPEFISFDMMLSEQSFKSSSLFLDRFDLFIYFAKHLAIVNSICCIGI